MKKNNYQYKYIFIILYLSTSLSSHLRTSNKGPKEKSLWNKMQSRIPIINPLELDSPFIQGMGHDMLEEVEKLALEDTNKGTTPVFPMRPGYDSNLIFGIVGKPLPNNLIQWAKAQKGRVPYVIKVGQNIANRVQAIAYASIPSIPTMDEKIDESIKIGDKIDFQVEKSKPRKPLDNTKNGGSMLAKIKDKATEMAKEQVGKVIDKVKNMVGKEEGDQYLNEKKKLEYAVSLNQNRS